MFRWIRYSIYIIILFAIGFGYWFLPKYAYIHNNPSYCTELAIQFYYCGTNAKLETLFNLGQTAEGLIR